MPKKVKTEHSGAKNGGGYWGKREEAKKVSNKARRENDKKEAKKAKDD
ncbi:MAG: hypothetical protein ACXABY_23125 [Candidatus Thorarchaeota archaeon]|jgi:hypothetical protein